MATHGQPRPWFRFPFGARDTRTIGLANCLDHGSVRWSVDTLGWKRTPGGQTRASVTKRVLDADALADLIARVEARGYRFVDLDAYR